MQAPPIALKGSYATLRNDNPAEAYTAIRGIIKHICCNPGYWAMPKLNWSM